MSKEVIEPTTEYESTVTVDLNNQPETNATPVVFFDADEKQDLKECEAIIENGLTNFLQTCNALMRIRTFKLYKLSGYQTFEDYCNERWNFTRQYASRLILATKVEEELSTVVDKDKPILQNANQSDRFRKLNKDEQNRVKAALKLGSDIEDELEKSEGLMKLRPQRPIKTDAAKARDLSDKLTDLLNGHQGEKWVEDILKTFQIILNDIKKKKEDEQCVPFEE